MKDLLIVNGEAYWPDFLPEFRVQQKKIQTSSWMLKDQALYVMDAAGVVQPDAILWRVGAIRPSARQTTALNLIDLAGIPCVNPAATLKIGYDRLSMLATLRKLNLPVIPFQVVTRATLLHNVQLAFPFVVKAGNYHGGYGKALIRNEKEWREVRDLLFVADTYVTVEPFVDYVRDIRYLAIGDRVWAMARKGKYWKANVETTDFTVITPEAPWVDKVQLLQAHLGADIVAVDILQEADGKMHIVEYNDIPGLSGFSDELKYELAAVVRRKIEPETSI